MRIAHLGPVNTFGHFAAIRAGRRFFKSEIESHLCPTNQAVVEAVASGQVDFGIVPIFNSIADVVIASMDAIYHSWQNNQPVYFFGEVIMPIEHCLIGLQQATLGGIQTVHSHPHAIGQCRDFISRMELLSKESDSTAEAVQLVASSNNKTLAAIGSKEAAEALGLKVLTEKIQDSISDRNLTRFMLISNQHDHDSTGNDSTWLAFTTKADRPGSLVDALIPLKDEEINMHAVHSRANGKIGSFLFYIGFDGHRQDQHVTSALSKMKNLTDELIVFGSHPKDRY